MVSIGIVEVHLHLQVHQEASSFQVEENFQVVVVGIDDVVVVVDGGGTTGDDADCCEGCTVFDVVDVVVVVGGVEMNGESAIFPISNKDVPPT
mmetsp:Transcript_16870/g.27724  ORF Transcript_16870/g.27724 Transcript_16870/m.27724 type:complete len:93 (+) Transcript_16870:131-409(+)